MADDVDDDEVSVADLAKILSDNRVDVELLIEQNFELLETIFDMQEFMMERGYTKSQFIEWKEKKIMRSYH